MIILNVFFKVKAESRKEFLGELNNMVTKSSAESGNTLYKLWQDIHDENSYVLVEHWDDAKSLKSHQGTEHWKHFDSVVNDYLHSHYEEHHYEEIPK